ncbi:MAG: hypothetical protein QNK31_00890 [Porticoccus sp.]|nr:hypothetical protein [Porticoccus sp.]
MTDEPKDKKNALINELDSLRCTLNNGPEFQHNIPTLDELYADDDSFMHDPALNVPILTDALEEEPAFIQEVTAGAEDSAFMIEKQCAMTVDLDIFDGGHPSHPLSAPPETTVPTTLADEQNVINIHALCKETDSSVIELEHVLDELVAEQLPKLEQQLREKLRHELEAGLNAQAKSEPTFSAESNKPTSDS